MERETREVKSTIIAGLFSLGVACVTGVFGVIYGKSTTAIVINNLQGDSIKVSPLKAEREYAELYSKYLDLKNERKQLENKLDAFGNEAKVSQEIAEQRDRVQNMLEICESKIEDKALSKSKNIFSDNSSVIGKWKGQVISEGLPVVVSVDVDSLKLGEKTMTITYGSPRTCTSRGEYAGAVGENEELFYLREPTPRTWCGQFTYFTDATIKFKRTSSDSLNYEIRDIKKFKKTIESATIQVEL